MLISSHVKLHGEMEMKVCAGRNDLLKKKIPRIERQPRGPALHVSEFLRSADGLSVRERLCREAVRPRPACLI